MRLIIKEVFLHMLTNGKKIFAFVLIFCLAFCFLTPASAAGEIFVDNASLDVWENGWPEYWNFDSDGAMIEQMRGEDGSSCAKITLTGPGYAFLSQEIQLESEKVYMISCRIKTENVSAAYPAANINIWGQPQAEDGFLADTQGDWQEMRLCVKTNVDDFQTYTIRFGLGNEDSDATGTVYIDSIRVEEMDEDPADLPIHTLVGSLAQAGGLDDGSDGEGSGDEETSRYHHSREDITYNDVGEMLFAITAFIAVYLLITSVWKEKMAHFLQNKWAVLLIFAAAVGLRLVIAYREPGHITDMNCFASWANQLTKTGLGGFYSSGIFADYPPGYMYILYPIGLLGNALGWQLGTAEYSLLVRIPAILCDAVLAYVVYRIGKKRMAPGSSMLISLLVLFSPALIATSSSWGQIDSVFILAAVGSLYLLQKDKKVYAAMLLMVTFMIKPQALIIAPVFAIVYLADIFTKGRTKRALWDTLLSFVGMAGVYLLLAVPMMPEGSSFLYVFERMAETMGQYAYGSVNAFNLMALFGGNFANMENGFLFGTYGSFGAAFIALAILAAAVLYFKKRDKGNIFLLSAFVVISVFVLGHEMHERYILPGIVFLLIAAMQKDSRKLTFLGMLLSILAFLNIQIVLLYGADAIDTLVVIILSAMTVVAYGFFVWLCVRHMAFAPEEFLRISAVPETMPGLKERKRRSVKERLESFPLEEKGRRMNKRDAWVLSLITGIYAVFAFTNLGSLVIPARTQPVTAQGDSAYIFELSESQDIYQWKYYAGYCEGNMQIFISEDGEEYTPLLDGNVKHEYGDMFKWHFNDFGGRAKFIRIEVTQGDIELREVAFTDSENNLLPIAGAWAVRDGVQEEAPYLYDEQDQVPTITSALTDMYFDEVYHARTAYEYMEGLYPYEITHPPLGKSIITIGIQIFGFNPFGWRFMGALFGVLQLPVFYIFAKRLFKKTKWAAIGTVLFAADFMHFDLTRIATIDSYSIFFILLMYLFMYEYSQHNFNREKLWKTFIPLGLCGISFALGAATKWLCIYAGLGLCVLFFYTVYQRYQEYKYARENGMEEIAANYKKKLTLTILFCVLVFIIIPVIVYVASYAPYFNNTEREFGLLDVWKNQEYMLNYHGNLKTDTPHPYSSRVFTWPLNVHPVFFFMAEGEMNGLSGLIWCIGNPLVWWGGLLGVLYLIGMRKNRGQKLKGLPFIAIAALSQYLPWTLISREVFIYHYFATLPFLILALVYALRRISGTYKHGKQCVYAYVALCVVAFFLFYPIMTGVLVSRSYNLFLQWLPNWPVV